MNFSAYDPNHLAGALEALAVTVNVLDGYELEKEDELVVFVGVA